ncbi:MAG: DUF402 domain-containing protein [Nitrospirota bacterium]
MEVGLKIRGIYATALTKFFTGHNLAIVLPSKQIRERFRDYKKIDSPEPIEVEIIDLEDLQGILLRGKPGKLNFVVGLIREKFFDAITRERKYGGFDFVEIEFPFLAKSALDELRNMVTPTVLNHHRLKIIASEYVDLMEEMHLSGHPEKRETVGMDLEKRFIWGRFEERKEIAIEHVKLDGKVISLSEGEIIEFNPEERSLLLQRAKFRGKDKYDGLVLPKESGDYAITEVREGDWFYKHTYYRQDGQLVGEYYNINTPIEFYPDKIRYIDLEMDVIRWPDGRVEIMEEKLLDQQQKSGYLREELVEKAKSIAKELKEKLSDSLSSPSP